MNFTEDPQNEYYYYDGGEEYGDVYYDNEEYKETYNYEDASEGKKYFLFLSKRTQKNRSSFMYFPYGTIHILCQQFFIPTLSMTSDFLKIHPPIFCA